MAFAGFRSGLQEEINGWGLADRIIREFNLRLIHDVSPAKPIEFPVDDKSMVETITLQDPVKSTDHYCFHLRFHRTQDEEDFLITDCWAECFSGGEQTWRSAD